MEHELHGCRVRLVGRFSRRVSLALFKLHSIAYLSSDGTSLQLFKVKEGETLLSSGKCLGRLSNVLVAHMGDKRRAEWRISIIGDSDSISHHRFQCDTIEEAQQWLDFLETYAGSTPIVTVLGNPGIGKSQLSSSLAGLQPGNHKFASSSKSSSAQLSPSATPHLCQWFGGSDGDDTDEFVVLTCPNFVETRGSRKQVADFTRTIQGLGRLNALILVVDWKNPELSRSVIETLYAMQQIIGSRLWNQLCLVFVKSVIDTDDAGAQQWNESKAKDLWFQKLPDELREVVMLSVDSLDNIPGFRVDLGEIAMSDGRVGHGESGTSVATSNSATLQSSLTRSASFNIRGSYSTKFGRSMSSSDVIDEEREWNGLEDQQVALDRLSVVVRTMPALLTQRQVMLGIATGGVEPSPSGRQTSSFVTAPLSRRNVTFNVEEDFTTTTSPIDEEVNRSHSRHSSSGRFSISRLSRRLSGGRPRSWRASRESYRDSQMDDTLKIYLERLGLERHFETIVSEGLYTPDELQVVPNTYLSEMGFSAEEIEQLKPVAGLRRWHHFENTTVRLKSELDANQIRHANNIDELTPSDVLVLPEEVLPRYFPRVKDRIRFRHWRQNFMANRIIDDDKVPLWIGAIVERGPDWCYDVPDSPPEKRQDGGGSGCPGKVVGWYRSSGERIGVNPSHIPKYPGWVRVTWLSNGNSANYRMEHKKADLMFLSRPDRYHILNDLVPNKHERREPSMPPSLSARRPSWAAIAFGGLSNGVTPPPNGIVDNGQGHVPANTSPPGSNDSSSLEVARLRANIHLGILRCTFLYPLGESLVQLSRFDIRDEVCLAVGGLTHGQVVIYKLDGSKHVVIGVAVDSRRIRMYFQPKEGSFTGAGMFPNANRDSFEVVGREDVPEATMEDEILLFDDKAENDVMEHVRSILQCDFPYLCGTQYARVAMFDVRDEVCKLLGSGNLCSGDTLRNRESGVVIWVVGVKLDNEGNPRLWYHTNSVVGCGTNQGFHPLQYEKLPDKTELTPCAVPIQVSKRELDEIVRDLDVTFSFPRRTGSANDTAIEDSRFDIRDHVATRLCGYPPGTVFLGPDSARVTVIGVGLGDDRQTPQVYFYIQSHPGATLIPDFNELQHYFSLQDERQDLTELRRELDVRQGGSSRAMMMVQNLLRQQEVVARSRTGGGVRTAAVPTTTGGVPDNESSLFSTQATNDTVRLGAAGETSVQPGTMPLTTTVRESRNARWSSMQDPHLNLFEASHLSPVDLRSHDSEDDDDTEDAEEPDLPPEAFSNIR